MFMHRESLSEFELAHPILFVRHRHVVFLHQSSHRTTNTSLLRGYQECKFEPYVILTPEFNTILVCRRRAVTNQSGYYVCCKPSQHEPQIAGCWVVVRHPPPVFCTRVSRCVIVPVWKDVRAVEVRQVDVVEVPSTPVRRTPFGQYTRSRWF